MALSRYMCAYKLSPAYMVASPDTIHSVSSNQYATGSH